MVISIGSDGGCRFLIDNMGIMPVIWHQVVNQKSVSVVEDLGLYNSLCQHPIIIVLSFW